MDEELESSVIEVCFEISRNMLAGVIGYKARRLTNESMQAIVDYLSRYELSSLFNMRYYLDNLDLEFCPLVLVDREGNPVPGDLLILPKDGYGIEREAALAVAALTWYKVEIDGWPIVHILASKEALENTGIDIVGCQALTEEGLVDFDNPLMSISIVPDEAKRFSFYDGFIVR